MRLYPYVVCCCFESFSDPSEIQNTISNLIHRPLVQQFYICPWRTYPVLREHSSFIYMSMEHGSMWGARSTGYILNGSLSWKVFPFRSMLKQIAFLDVGDRRHDPRWQWLHVRISYVSLEQPHWKCIWRPIWVLVLMTCIIKELINLSSYGHWQS